MQFLKEGIKGRNDIVSTKPIYLQFTYLLERDFRPHSQRYRKIVENK